MEMAVRWRIATENRVGMALDILSVIADAGLDVEAMEVLPGVAYLRLEGAMDTAVQARLLGLPGVKAVGPVSLMPEEERARELSAVLQAVSDGVLVLRDGRVAGMNPAAERVLLIAEADARGMDGAQVLGTDRLVRGLASFDHEEVRAQTPRGHLHYVASGRALDEEGGGMVLALKSIQQARQLVHALTRPPAFRFSDLITTSQVMSDVIRIAQAASRVDAPVLIQGESGTGKEIFARAIHSESDRANGPFVPVNCAALPETLLESELFGYEEGSFTGAKRGGKQGIFEFASGGTVFLDEIGELPGHLQAKLLRVLQEGRVRRVGAREESPVDVRVIAATNRNLRAMVVERQFRDDLYYRLNVIPLVIPPLRARPEDIDVLVAFMLERWRKRTGRAAPHLSDEAWRRLREHPWPGNVRELENTVERALALTTGPVVGVESLMLESPALASQTLHQGSLKERLAEVERQILTDVLMRTGSARRAAEVLSVSHTTVLNKVHRLGLSHLLKE